MTNLYQYDRLNRLTNLVWKQSGLARGDFFYKLGLTGNRTNLSETINSVSRSYVWNYDALYRLTNETVSGTAPTGTLGYGYDIVGNRTNRTGSLGSLGTQTLSYNTNDWLTTDGYDNNGSTTLSGGSNYLYDVEGRLTNVNNGAIVMVYNGDGVRVSKTVGGVTTTYLVAERNPTGYAQVLDEVSDDGTERRYTIGNDLISQTRWDGSSFTTHFYGYDGHGSVRFLTDTSGAITDTYTYDAYGVKIASTGSTPNHYLYAGEQFDPHLNASVNRARLLNLNTGRFQTSDSFEGYLSDPRSLHKYLYCHSDPVNFTDPSGQFEFSLAGMTINVSLQTYLVSTVSSYAIGKVTSAATLLAFSGSLNEFEWLEPWDALSLVPGAVIAGATAKIVRIPIELVTKTQAGKLVGKYFLSGEVNTLVSAFRSTVASAGGQLTIFGRNATRLVLKPEAFEHIVRRHMIRYWEGSTKKLTTFWPENMSASRLLDELKQAVSKISPNAGLNDVTLSNGIKAQIYVDESGLIKSFYPVSGPGVFSHNDLYNTLK